MCLNVSQHDHFHFLSACCLYILVRVNAIWEFSISWAGVSKSAVDDILCHFGCVNGDLLELFILRKIVLISNVADCTSCIFWYWLRLMWLVSWIVSGVHSMFECWLVWWWRRWEWHYVFFIIIIIVIVIVIIIIIIIVVVVIIIIIIIIIIIVIIIIIIIIISWVGLW